MTKVRTAGLGILVFAGLAVMVSIGSAPRVAPNCSIDAPAWDAMPPSTMLDEPTIAGVPIAWVRGDHSGLVVALCANGPEVQALTFVDGAGEVLRRMGGAFAPSRIAPQTIVVFPPPPSGGGAFRLGSAPLVRIELASREIPCADKIRSTSGLTSIACGGLLRLRWETRIPIRADEVGIVDVSVIDTASSEHLGFFLIGARDSANGLVIDFSTEWIAHAELSVEVKGLLDRKGKQIMMPRLVATLAIER